MHCPELVGVVDQYNKKANKAITTQGKDENVGNNQSKNHNQFPLVSNNFVRQNIHDYSTKNGSLNRVSARVSNSQNKQQFPKKR